MRLFNHCFSESATLGLRSRRLIALRHCYSSLPCGLFSFLSTRGCSRRRSSWSFRAAIQKALFPLGAEGRARRCAETKSQAEEAFPDVSAKAATKAHMHGSMYNIQADSSLRENHRRQ